MTCEPAYDSYQAWLASRPEVVQRLAHQFPPGTRVHLDGDLHWVVGWDEGGLLILSPINPSVDYDAALAAKVYLCPDHLEPL